MQPGVFRLAICRRCCFTVNWSISESASSNDRAFSAQFPHCGRTAPNGRAVRIVADVLRDASYREGTTGIDRARCKV